MEILIFIFTQSMSYLVGILSGLFANYIERKIKNRSTSTKTKSGIELDIKIKFKITKN